MTLRLRGGTNKCAAIKCGQGRLHDYETNRNKPSEEQIRSQQGDTDELKCQQMDEVVQGTSVADWMCKLVKLIATVTLEFQQRSSEPWSLRYRQGEQTASSKKDVMDYLQKNGICDLLKAIGFELAYVHAWEYHIHRKTECCNGDSTSALSLLGYHHDSCVLRLFVFLLSNTLTHLSLN